MNGFIIDEMFPPATAALLREKYRREADHVNEIALASASDAEVARTARAQDRAVVTENVADFAGEHGVVLVFILKRNLPRGGTPLAARLAEILDRWAAEYPDPYVGQHWPSTGIPRQSSGEMDA